MPPQYCAPKKFGKGDTCLTRKELLLIAHDYNNSISNPKKKIGLSLSKKRLYNVIRERLSDTCDDEYCFIEQGFVADEHKRELESSFRPKKPREWYKNKRTWLNTFDILHVMKQYEALHKNFTFYGVFPMDFQKNYPSSTQCIGSSLCTFHISDLFKRKKEQFAFVLNLDHHNQSGSHWVSVYGNLNPNKNNFGIYYYDSVSNEPTKEVRQFFTQVATQVKEYFQENISKKFTIKFNTVQKQFKNTECGVFSMVFITQMLKYIDFDYICKFMKKDDQMNDIRDVLYRPNKI